MKKLLAILLAVLMALAGMAALAEGGDALDAPAEAAGFQGLTLTSDIDVDRDVLANVLTTFAVPEDVSGIADNVAAVLGEAGERLIITGEGAEYALTLKDRDIVNLVGTLDENGISLASNLVPNYVLTVSAETALQALMELQQKMGLSEDIDMTAAQEAFDGYFDEFIEACSSAVIFGDPVEGDYVMDGYQFNIMVPVEVDIEAIATAAQNFVNQLKEDEAVQAAIEALGEKGLQVDLDAADDKLNVDELPTMTMEAYMNMDEQGNAGDTTMVVFDVYAPGAEEGADPATVGDVLVEGNKVTVNLQFVSADNSQLSVSYLPDDEAGTEIRVDAFVKEMYFGFDMRYTMGDVIVLDADLFVLDDQNPLASEHCELTMGGELTLSADGEGKTVLALEELMGDESDEALGGLVSDLTGNGLGGLISTALEAMPEEIGAIAGMLTGGQAADAE